jgi:hypothetical protein
MEDTCRIFNELLGKERKKERKGTLKRILSGNCIEHM